MSWVQLFYCEWNSGPSEATRRAIYIDTALICQMSSQWPLRWWSWIKEADLNVWSREPLSPQAVNVHGTFFEFSTPAARPSSCSNHIVSQTLLFHICVWNTVNISSTAHNVINSTIHDFRISPPTRQYCYLLSSLIQKIELLWLIGRGSTITRYCDECMT